MSEHGCKDYDIMSRPGSGHATPLASPHLWGTLPYGGRPLQPGRLRLRNPTSKGEGSDVLYLRERL